MKKSKKLFSILLAVLVLMASIPVAASAAGSTTVPTVYIQGYGATIYKDSYDSSSEIIAGSGYGQGVFRDDTLGNLLTGDSMKLLLDGIATGDYSEFNDYVVDTFLVDMAGYALDDNGEATDGSGRECTSNLTPGNKINGGKYDLYAYGMEYDWRLDTYTNAERLYNYILHVREVTGYNKVNVVGRCLGANIVLTYLDVYGTEFINSIEFYVPGFYGFEAVAAIMSGEIVIDPDVLDKFINYYIASEDDTMSFVKSLVTLLNYIRGLNFPVEVIQEIYNQIYTDVLPRVLRESLGTLPSFWTFTGEYYEAAKELNFGTPELQEQFAGLIKKTDKYHNEIYSRTQDIIQGAIDDGVNVYIIAKYGMVMYPLAKEASYQGDDTCSIMSSTLGGTCTILDETFSNSYIKNAKANGTYKYISADKCIDLSTAFLPDHTWVVKGNSHATMPDSVDVMMATIFEENGYRENGSKYVTVNDMQQYPQYLKASENTVDATLSPLTEENSDENAAWNSNPFRNLLNFISKFFKIITKIFKGEFEFNFGA